MNDDLQNFQFIMNMNNYIPSYYTSSRANIKNVDEYVSDVIYHSKIMKQQYPGLPLFIIGHSMGGLVTIQTILNTQHQRLFEGAVISSPLLGVTQDMDTPVNRMIAKGRFQNEF